MPETSTEATRVYSLPSDAFSRKWPLRWQVSYLVAEPLLALLASVVVHWLAIPASRAAHRLRERRLQSTP
jgi:hypothetical protein